MNDAIEMMVRNELVTHQLSDSEKTKRSDLARRKPYVAKKLAANKERQEKGFPTPVLRLAANMLCNFQCNHCCAEHYMDRHLVKLTGKPEQRHQLDGTIS